MPIDQLSIRYEDYLDLIRQIHKLPLRRTTTCTNCETENSYLTLDIYATCSSCGLKTKTRSFGAYIEPQDIIAAVLAWLGDEPDSHELIRRRNDYFDFDLLEESGDNAE